MPNFIPEEIIEQINSRIDIVEIISKYIPLKRTGRNFKALCPFHNEKTPSFVVSPHKQIYRCFGCGSGGNIYNFIMKYEHLEFPEAVKLLAEKAGVNMPKLQFHRDSSDIEELYGINTLACDFFHNNLLNAEEAKVARNFLRNKEIKDDTIAKFKLGFAQNLRSGLYSYLSAKEAKKQLIEKLGLAVTGNDRFRNKFMLPIFNHRNKIAGFGARALDDTLPKYINSPESPIYVKGSLLYGLNFSSDHIRKLDKIIVVEGYMDVLTLFQQGIRNIVAASGTSLTTEQAGLIKRLTNNVVIIFDPDEAGKLASIRGLELLLDFEMDVSIVGLPSGFDPDDFVRKFGAEKFNNMITQAKDIFDYKLEFLLNKYDMCNLKDKLIIISDMLRTISRVKNSILKANLIRRLSEAASENEEELLIELKKVKNNQLYDFSDIKRRDISKNTRQAERIILGIALEDKDLLSEVKGKFYPEDFHDINIKKVMSVLFEIDTKDGISISSLLCRFEDEAVRDIICEVMLETDKLSDKRKNLDDCVNWLKQDNLKKALKDIQQKIKLAQEIKNENLMLELVSQYNDLVKNKRQEL
jgi:DNA primase